MIDCETEKPGGFPQKLRVREFSFRADGTKAEGGDDSAPGAHDYFDASLAACKALTATWYARKNNYPLERVETHIERDDSEERKGVYKLKVKVAFHGAQLTAEQKQKLHDVVGRCPVHKLMTTTEVIVETAPL